MVDASATCRMNPLAALSIDRNTLLRENLCIHGGIFYPGIRPLSAEKPQDPGTSLSLGYDLLYKPDIMVLDGQKPANGYVGLYKSPPPGLQKPLLVPAAGGDGLGLERQVGPNDKVSELGLNSTNSFLRLPWVSPYADAGMYPFLDMAYKASFLSQPSPYLHQHLAYQSLCAAGAGGSAAGADRLFYLPSYPLAPISSPLAPPIRIPTATPAPAVLSPLAHCQDKALQVHQEPSAFSSSPQIHQDQQQPQAQPQPQPQPLASQHTERQHSSSSSGAKPSWPSFSSTVSSSSGRNSTIVNSSTSHPALESPPALRTHSPHSGPRTPQTSVPQPLAVTDSTSDLQKSLYRSPSSSSSSSLSVSHPYVSSLTSGHCSPMRSGSNKTKDTSSDHWSEERDRSPSKTSLNRAVPQMAAKNPGEKPLDLSAKELEGFPSKLEALAKLGY